MHLNEQYLAALNGTLRSPLLERQPETIELQIFNYLPATLSLWWIDDGGRINPFIDNIQTKKTWEVGPLGDRKVKLLKGQFYAMRAFDSSFVTVFKAGNLRANHRVNITNDLLIKPNEIGKLIPRPTADQPIPADSPMVCVGCGLAENGKSYIVRSQFWKMTSDSLTLVPGAESLVSVTTAQGRTETSSNSSSVSSSISTSASMGWGPISTSISASLSKTSSTFHSVTTNEQKTRFESMTIKNSSSKTLTYFNWQIMDSITVFDQAGKTLATLNSLLVPPVIRSAVLEDISDEEKPSEDNFKDVREPSEEKVEVLMSPQVLKTEPVKLKSKAKKKT